MAKVESFTLDHTAVLAPYVRLIRVETEPKGDRISNFDLRLVQSNENTIPTRGLYTIEHLLAFLLYDRMEGVIDCLPFGCRVGFHLITWGTPGVETMTRALIFSLGVIATSMNWQDVPGTDITSCGNYRDHSLSTARERCKKTLEEGSSTNPPVRMPLPEPVDQGLLVDSDFASFVFLLPRADFLAHIPAVDSLPCRFLLPWAGFLAGRGGRVSYLVRLGLVRADTFAQLLFKMSGFMPTGLTKRPEGSEHEEELIILATSNPHDDCCAIRDLCGLMDDDRTIYTLGEGLHEHPRTP